MALIIFLILLLASTSCTSTPFELIACGWLTYQDPSTNTTLDTFFTALVAQSNSANFNHTIIVNATTSVDGHYQCSANLSHTDCQTCVKKLASIIPRPCKSATAELVNCNMTYDVDQNQVIDSGLTSDGGEDYGGCIGAFVASVVAIVVSMLLQS